jgi:hypothetical protein
MSNSLERTTRAVADDAEQRANSVGGSGVGGTIIGTGSTILAAGVGPAVPLADIKATSKVYYSLRGVNASTTLGIPTAVITPGVGFSTLSEEVASPGTTQAGDDSTYNYLVIE